VCLAVPGQIERLEGDRAQVAVGPNRYNVCTALTPEVKQGDWVLVHAGYSIAKLDPQEARETYELIVQAQAAAAQTSSRRSRGDKAE